MIKVPFFNKFSKRKEKPRLSAVKLRFLAQTEIIRAECEKIEPLFHESAKELFRIYMSAVWKKAGDEKWFEENKDEYAQSWFICAFLSENCLATLKAEENEYIVIQPKAGAEDYVLLTAEPEPLSRDTGNICIRYAPVSKKLMSCARRIGFKNEGGMLIKRVDRYDAPLEDRAAEAGAELLKNGFGIYVKNERLAVRIEKGEFTPLAPYRIYAGEEKEVLIASFPHDRELYQLFVRNGGRWTGKRLEFPVWAFETLEDVIGICGFRVEEEAKKRSEAWKRAAKEATVYTGIPERKDPERKTVKELFDAFLTREREEITDLYESEID